MIVTQTQSHDPASSFSTLQGLQVLQAPATLHRLPALQAALQTAATLQRLQSLRSTLAPQATLALRAMTLQSSLLLQAALAL